MTLLHRAARRLAPCIQWDEHEKGSISAAVEGQSPCFLLIPEYLQADHALLEEKLRLGGSGRSWPLILPDDQQADSFESGIIPLRAGHLTAAGAGVYRRSVLAFLDRLKERFPRCVFVPAVLAAGYGPDPFLGSERVRGPRMIRNLLRLAAAAIHRKRLRLICGPIIVMTAESRSISVLRRGIKWTARLHSSIRGLPGFKRRGMEREVLTCARLQTEIRAQAKLTGTPEERLHRTAARELRRMAGQTAGWAIDLFSLLLSPLARRAFVLDLSMPEETRAALRSGPVLLLPSHRSHFDYLLLSFVLFHEGLRMPYIAAGDNLNFWPMGRLFQAAGGFFIRRRIGGDELYKALLESYLGFLIRHGALVEFFIEGGRSRSGAMRGPKVGLLKYIVADWERRGARGRLNIVPVAINYELLPEEESLVREMSGAPKEPESWRSLLRLWAIRKREHGPVRIVFGIPRCLPEERNNAAAAERELSRFAAKTAEQASSEILQIMPVTGRALACTALLSLRSLCLSASDVGARLLELDNLLSALPGGKPAEAAYARAAALVGRMSKPAENGELFVQLEREDLLRLIYYKNTIVHLFLLPAAAACSCADCLSDDLLFLWRTLKLFFPLGEETLWTEKAAAFASEAAGGFRPVGWGAAAQSLILPFLEAPFAAGRLALELRAGTAVPEEEFRLHLRRSLPALLAGNFFASCEAGTSFMFDYAIAVLEEHGLLEIAPRQAGAGRRAGPEDNLVRIGGEEHIDAFISRLSCFMEKSR